MPLSFDISAQSNAPVPPAEPAQGVSVAARPVGTSASEQGIADQVGAVATGGTFDGLTFSYSAVTRTISGTNTDKGSIAVSTHEAATDPHPQYHTAPEVAADIAAHSAAMDPHGDRTYTDAAIGTHEAAVDPHPQYLTETEADLLYDGLGSAALAQAAAKSYADSTFLPLTGGDLSGNVAVRVQDVAAMITLHTASNTNSIPPLVYARRSGGTLDTPTAVASGMNLGGFAAQGYDGSTWTTSRASVEFLAAEAWSPSGHGTSLALRTTSPGAAAISTRFTVGSAGEWIVGTSSPGAAGDVFTSGGAGAAPAWTAPQWLPLSGGTLTGGLTVSGGTITGSGSGLTSLNGSNITAGTVADAHLSSNVPRKNAANTFTALQAIQVGAAGTNQHYLRFRPTDYGIGKPFLFVKTLATSAAWGIGLYDGATNTGSLLLDASAVTAAGTLGVTGATTLSSTLSVTGASTLSGNTTVGGTLSAPSINVNGGGAVSALSSGSGSATVTGVSNVSSIVAATIIWSRIGDVVIWSLQVNVTPAAGGTLTVMDLTPPIASNFTNTNHAIGGGGVVSGRASTGARGYSVAATDVIRCDFSSLGTSSHDVRISGSYRVL